MTIGIALSGGGARGIVHLGALQALHEMDIKPTRLAGTSAGAIIGALYCNGYTPKEIMEIFEETKFLKYISPTIGKAGLLNIEKTKELYLHYLPHDSFEALKYPLSVAATDIEKGKTIYFSEGALIQPILASACIPVVFNPVAYQGHLLVDGGILNNLPAEVLRPHCDKLIGVHSNPYINVPKIDSMRTIIEKSLMLALTVNAHQSMQLCDIALEPPQMGQFGTFDIKKAKEIFQIGYDFTYEQRSEIEAKLKA